MITIQNVLTKLDNRAFAQKDESLSTLGDLKKAAEEAAVFTGVSCPVLNQLLDQIFVPHYGQTAWLGANIVIALLVRLSQTDAEAKVWLDFTVEKLTDKSYIKVELIADMKRFSEDARSLVGNLDEELRKCIKLQRSMQQLVLPENYPRMLMGVIAMLAILDSPHQYRELVLQE